VAVHGGRGTCWRKSYHHTNTHTHTSTEDGTMSTGRRACTTIVEQCGGHGVPHPPCTTAAGNFPTSTTPTNSMSLIVGVPARLVWNVLATTVFHNTREPPPSATLATHETSDTLLKHIYAGGVRAKELWLNAATVVFHNRRASPQELRN